MYFFGSDYGYVIIWGNSPVVFIRDYLHMTLTVHIAYGSVWNPYHKTCDTQTLTNITSSRPNYRILPLTMIRSSRGSINMQQSLINSHCMWIGNRSSSQVKVVESACYPTTYWPYLSYINGETIVTEPLV